MSTLTLSPAFRPAAPRARSTVRLTRRGRLAVFLFALTLVLGAAILLASGAAGTDEAGTPPVTEVVLVGPGDTLWGIASDAAVEGSDVRDVMTQIEHLNALDSSGLQSGQKLRVPVLSE